MNARSVNLILLAVCFGLAAALVMTLRLVKGGTEGSPAAAEPTIVTNKQLSNQPVPLVIQGKQLGPQLRNQAIPCGPPEFIASPRHEIY